MAKPTVDGDHTSAMYGSLNCDVIRETISIKLTNITKGEFAVHNILYKVAYQIFSPEKKTVPLVFVGRKKSAEQFVIVNGKKLLLASITEKNVHKFKFIKEIDKKNMQYSVRFDRSTEDIIVDLSELIYFEAPLEEGNNEIVVEYLASPEYNIYGLLQEYTTRYNLQPSFYWKSFGPIQVDIQLPEGMEIRDFNMGKLTKLDNGKFQLNISGISKPELEIVYSNKVSVFGQLLLTIEPIGLSCIVAIISIFFHIRWIGRQAKKTKKQLILSVIIGSFLVTIVTYSVFVFTHDFILWYLDSTGLKKGYLLLAVFTAPIFLLVYGLFSSLVVAFILSKQRKID